MRESVVSFGKSAPLFGVLTEPSEDLLNAENPTLVLLNSGLLGRVGPFRLHVILARELAKTGFKTFRLDLSGVGDSGRHWDSRPREQQHLSDFREALDYLENRSGVAGFIVMGICTGADNAHRAMLEDERVVGAICVDGYRYPTFRYFANHYIAKILRLTSWKNIVKRFFRLFDNSRLSKSAPSEEDQLYYRWKLPPKDKTESDYREFIRRGVRLLCVYTAGWRYNYTGQLADSFRSLDFGDVISVAYLPDATHTFKVDEDRKLLITEIMLWLRSNWEARQ